MRAVQNVQGETFAFPQGRKKREKIIPQKILLQLPTLIILHCFGEEHHEKGFTAETETTWAESAGLASIISLAGSSPACEQRSLHGGLRKWAQGLESYPLETPACGLCRVSGLAPKGPRFAGGYCTGPSELKITSTARLDVIYPVP